MATTMATAIQGGPTSTHLATRHRALKGRDILCFIPENRANTH